MTPRIGSLFSGYGGLDMAVQAVYGGEVVWYSEIDKHACTVLEALHPAAPNLGDITNVDWAAIPPIDILTGGYPCQPFSHAGQRKGTTDERHLWPYVRDAIVALRPVVTVLENVDGHRSLGLDVVLGDLADLGLSARWGVVRAADAGAPHSRKRVFITVTDPNGEGPQRAGARVDVAARWSDAGGHVAQGADGPAADAYGFGHSEARRAATTQASRTSTALDGRDGVPARMERHAAAYTDGAGSEARGITRPDGQRFRSQPVGPPSPAPDSCGGSLARAAATADGLPISAECSRVDWGKYTRAIRRWERLIGPAPSPTMPGTNGRPRLSPAFVEWMMGLPEGHVTGHGLTPAACLKMLGNGVLPQQAELALRMLAVADA